MIPTRQRQEGKSEPVGGKEEANAVAGRAEDSERSTITPHGKELRRWSKLFQSKGIEEVTDPFARHILDEPPFVHAAAGQIGWRILPHSITWSAMELDIVRT